MSRQKGKRGERQAAAFIRDEWGVEARRGRQFSGSPDSPDVVIQIENMHIEVKAREVGEGKVRDWLEEAATDAPDRMPVLMHRRNRKDWLLTIKAAHAVGFARGLLAAKREEA
jgi:Holliday junction resolvase